MIMEPHIIPQDAVIDMVRFQQVLQGARPLVRVLLYVMDRDRGYGDARGTVEAAFEEGGHANAEGAEGEHRVILEQTI